MDNIQDADVSDMQLICKYNKGTDSSLYVIGISSENAQLLPLKDKKKLLQLLMHLKKNQMYLILNKTNFGQVEVVNLTIEQ